MDLRLALVLSAVDRMSGPLKAVSGQTRGVAGVAQAAQTQLNKLNQAMAQVDAFRIRKAAVVDAEKAWKESQAKVAALAKERNQVEKSLAAERATMSKADIKMAEQWLKANEAAMAQAKRGAAEAKASYERQRQSLHQLRQEMQAAGVSTRDLAGQQVKMAAEADKLRVKFDALSRATAAHQQTMNDRAGYRAQMIDAVALAASIGAPIKASIEFESVMADVKKVIDFDTPQQFSAMQQDILKLSTTIPMVPKGIGEIVAAAGQAGIAKNELMIFAQDAAKMGVAFDMSGKEAGSAMTGLRTIFALTQDQVRLLGDSFNHLSNNMDAKANDLVNIANRVGSTGKLIGLTGQQVGALGATFLALKTPPEVAATGMNALLLKLATADKQNEKFQQALSGLGMSATELKERMKTDAQGAILDFLETVNGAEDKMGVLSDLFGAEYSDDIAKLVGSLDTYKKALKLTADEAAYAGSMQKEYEARASTTANALVLLQNKTSKMAIETGSVLLPAVNNVVGVLGSAITTVSELAQKFPLVSQVIVTGVTALVALKIAAIASGYAWTFVKGGWQAARITLLALNLAMSLASGRMTLMTAATAAQNAGLLSFNAASAVAVVRTRAMAIAAGAGTAFKTLGAVLMAVARGAIPAVIGGMRLMTIAMMTNPIGLILVAIAAGAALIYAYWDDLAPFFKSTWDGIKNACAVAWDWIKGALSWTPLGMIIANWEPLYGFFSGLFDRIMGIAGKAFDWISEKVVGPLKAMKETLGGAWDTMFGEDEEDKKKPTVAKVAQAAAVSAAVVASPAAAMANSPAATQAAKPASIAIPAQAAKPAASPQTAKGGDTWNVTVTVNGDGMSAKQVGEEIARQLDAFKRKIDADKRAALHD